MSVIYYYDYNAIASSDHERVGREQSSGPETPGKGTNMRYEKGHKDATRARILEVASRQFRENGVAAAGLAGIMAEAGLTNGAFYAHFKSKEDLLRAVLAD